MCIWCYPPSWIIVGSKFLVFQGFALSLRIHDHNWGNTLGFHQLLWKRVLTSQLINISKDL
jgi:hypothetical protein